MILPRTMTTFLPTAMAISMQLARRATLTAAAWAGLTAAAVGQSNAGSGDEELLLSYRRADANNAADAASGSAPPAGDGSNARQTENSLRPAGEPTPAYRFPDVQPSTPNVATPPGTAVEEAAPRVAALETPPGPVDAEQATPEISLPRYGGGVERAVHEEPAPPAVAENKTSQPPAVEPVEPHVPKEAPSAVADPLAAAPLPGVTLPAAATDYSPAADESRHLAPRSKPVQGPAAGNGQSLSDGIKSRLPASFSKLDSLTTAGAGLAIVVGLFFVCMWLLRRTSGAKPGGLLPNEAFAVLGRAPLTPQSFAQLLRVGNKLVLVAVSADGIQPLTEVIDPLEVDRLTGVCASGRGHGPAAEFQQVLAQLAREPARGFLGAEAANGGGRRRA